MKKLIAFVLIINSCIIGFSQEVKDIRDLTWGMPKYLVNGIEGSNLKPKWINELYRYDTLFQKRVEVIFIFDDDELLHSVLYMFGKEYSTDLEDVPPA